SASRRSAATARRSVIRRSAFTRASSSTRWITSTARSTSTAWGRWRASLSCPSSSATGSSARTERPRRPQGREVRLGTLRLSEQAPGNGAVNRPGMLTALHGGNEPAEQLLRARQLARGAAAMCGARALERTAQRLHTGFEAGLLLPAAHLRRGGLQEHLLNLDDSTVDLVEPGERVARWNRGRWRRRGGGGGGRGWVGRGGVGRRGRGGRLDRGCRHGRGGGRGWFGRGGGGDRRLSGGGGRRRRGRRGWGERRRGGHDRGGGRERHGRDGDAGCRGGGRPRNGRGGRRAALDACVRAAAGRQRALVRRAGIEVVAEGC